MQIHSINIYLIFGPLSSTDIPEQRCKRWFIFQLSGICLLMGALDGILMLRGKYDICIKFLQNFDCF